MKQSLCLLLFFGSFLLQACQPGSTEPDTPNEVTLGAEVLLDNHLDELKGKRIGLVMNPASRVDDVHLLDTLLSLQMDIRMLFAAEHGFRGDAGAGETINDGIDSASGLPVYSLYKGDRRPDEQSLSEVDLLLFDLPDMGARFFTYNTTLGRIIEELSGTDKEIWILDRPDPAGGDYISGYILQDEHRSFVGSYPVPSAYGMSMGELAQMMVGEKWLELEGEVNMRVIPVSGWTRSMKWQDTDLPWYKPSPNLPTATHAFFYLGTVLFEGTNISEGRGTEDPFLQIGSPDLKFEQEELTALEQKHGVRLRKDSFRPVSIPGVAASPKFEGQTCTSIRISPAASGLNGVDPVALGYDLLLFIQDHSETFEVLPFINNLSGIDLKSLLENRQLLPDWTREIEKFRQSRAPYLIY